MSDETLSLLRQMVIDRLDKLDEKIDKNQEKMDERLRSVENKMNWAFGIATAVGSIMTMFAQKIYTIIFG